MTIIDQQYLDAIKRSEGFAPKAQWDYKQNTNGYGTRALYPGEAIDRDTAEQRFQSEIGKAAGYVDKIAPNAPPGVRAALTSLTFNAGPSWMNAGLGDAVKAGDWQNAAQRFQQYNKAGGETLPALERRRGEEVGWFDGQPSQGGQAMPAYSWTPGSQQPQPQAAQSPAATPQSPAANPALAALMAPQAGPSFDQLGKMLGLEDPPPLAPPPPLQQLQFAQAPFPGPFQFRRA